jgi:mono/diheme cytochrome c family protein
MRQEFAGLFEKLVREKQHMKTKMNQLRTVTLVVAIFTATCLLSAPAKADTAAGEATFKAKCSGCHGTDGKGKEAMKTTDMAAADVQKLSDADLSKIISEGKPPRMPAYKTLTPEQVKDLVSYIRSLKK